MKMNNIFCKSISVTVLFTFVFSNSISYSSPYLFFNTASQQSPSFVRPLSANISSAEQLDAHRQQYPSQIPVSISHSELRSKIEKTDFAKLAPLGSEASVPFVHGNDLTDITPQLSEVLWSALRTAGMLDDEGRPTEQFKKLRVQMRFDGSPEHVQAVLKLGIPDQFKWFQNDIIRMLDDAGRSELRISEMEAFRDEVEETEKWMNSDRFQGIKRLYSARQVVEQRGTIKKVYQVAHDGAVGMYARLRELFANRETNTTYGPY